MQLVAATYPDEFQASCIMYRSIYVTTDISSLDFEGRVVYSVSK